MNVTAYDVALIGGGFTVLGALIGALVTYQFSLRLMQRSMKLEAGRRLVAAFSNELATLDPVNKKQDLNVEQLLQGSFNKHYVAVIEFSHCLDERDKKTFLQVWENYYQVGGSVGFFDYYMGKDPYAIFKERVESILKFADT